MDTMLITKLEQLLPYEASYNALLRRIGGIESLYYSLDYIRMAQPVFECFGVSLFFILVVEGGEIVAVLPFQLKQDGIGNLRRTVSFWGAVDLYAMNAHRCILTEGYRPELVDAAIEFLRNEGAGLWDQIGFMWIKEGSVHVDYFSSRMQVERQQMDERFHVLDTRLDLDAHLGAKKLKELRRCRRRLEEECGPVEVRIKEEIDAEDLKEIKTMHTARQEQKHNSGAFFTRPLEGGYVCALLADWSRRKCVHYYALRVDSRPIAIWILFQVGEVSYGFIMAFDNEFGKYGPSRILTDAAFRHEAAHYGAKRIELGWGSNQLKEDYSSDSLALFRMRISNRRMRSRMVLLLIDGLFRLRRRFGIVDRLGARLRRR